MDVYLDSLNYLHLIEMDVSVITNDDVIGGKVRH